MTKEKSNYEKLMEQHEIMKEIISNTVYELKNVYDNVDKNKKFYINCLSQHYKNNNKKHNYVYFFRNKYNGFVKIGSTTDIVRRYNSMRSLYKNYLGLENILQIEGAIDTSYINPYILENYLHKKYKEYRKFGEWFEFPKKVWCELYNLYINKSLPTNMIDKKDVEKLGIENKVHNLMYLMYFSDKDFDDLLSECFSKEVILDEKIIETYIDDMVNKLSGIPFTKSKNIDNDESFYRLIYMIFEKYFADTIFTEEDCLIEFTKLKLHN